MRGLKFKTKKNRVIFFLSLAVFVVAAISATTALVLMSRIDYQLVDAPSFEINSEVNVASLFSSIDSGVLEQGEALIDTSEIGEKTWTVTFSNQLGAKQDVVVFYNVVDTTAPIITGDESELSFESGATDDILSRYQAEDNSQKPVGLAIEGDYNLGQPGEYNIKIVAKDESGNTSNKEVTIKVTEPPRPTYTAVRATSSNPYYVEVNRQQNVVIVYSLGSDGNYSNIAKVFVASTGAPGSETPLGDYSVSDRYESLFLVGNVWGHYAVRISGPFFFHSVPYFTKGSPWNNLEYLEYNKLGNGASAGCVRLSASDAKWVYDNIGYGTKVKIYDSASLPAGVVKPTAIKIDENSPNRGWDPTDPDPNNPWH